MRRSANATSGLSQFVTSHLQSECRAITKPIDLVEMAKRGAETLGKAFRYDHAYLREQKL
jgi:hypothetical protein